MYKVKWKGYGLHEVTWEPQNFSNAKEAVKKFHTQFPPKPQSHIFCLLEIPISQFPISLFQKMPEPLTELTPPDLPTEGLAKQLALSGTHA